MLNIDIDSNFEEILANLIIDKYKKYYKELEENRNIVLEELKKKKLNL